jgi:hypothetical protein
MPKRVLDFDALWASDKLAACAEWAQAEYAWFYGLADASGSFELTNLRVIWGRVAAIRKNLTLERVAQIFDEFAGRGLLFTWQENGKRYGHWTGSDVPGRLPAPSWRVRLERLAPPVPRDQLAAYMARFSSRAPVAAPSAPSADAIPAAIGESTSAAANMRELEHKINEHKPAESGVAERKVGELKVGLEVAQAQDLDLNLDLNEKWNREDTQSRACVSANAASAAAHSETGEACEGPEQMLEVYEAERGALPRAERLNLERRRQCALRLGAGLTLADFRAAVRRAAATPFLAGAGERGWRASFDWLVASDSNVRKVLEGLYDPPRPATNGAAVRVGIAWSGGGWGARAAHRNVPADVYAGAGPQPEAFGARVKAAALERIALRERMRTEAREERAGGKNARVVGSGRAHANKEKAS